MPGAYISHPIRGARGAAATHADMEANNRRAMEFARIVRAEFPGLSLYVPAEHDEFILLAYETGRLDEAAILAVDKLIIVKRDVLLAYAPEGYVSSGMQVEIAEAQRLGMPWCLTQGSLAPIHRLLAGLIR